MVLFDRNNQYNGAMSKFKFHKNEITKVNNEMTKKIDCEDINFKMLLK